MKTPLRNTAIAGFLAIVFLACTQPQQYAPIPMTHDMAMTVMAAAEAHARTQGWNVTILVTDQNGIPVMMKRLDGAPPTTIDGAQSKATVVAATGLTSAQYGEKVEAGELKEIEGGVTFGGGVPVYIDGMLVGTVAASGVRPERDEQISQAGAEAIGSVSAD